MAAEQGERLRPHGVPAGDARAGTLVVDSISLESTSMANARLGATLRHIRRLAIPQEGKERTDRELLHAFVSRRDEAALA